MAMSPLWPQIFFVIIIIIRKGKKGTHLGAALKGGQRPRRAVGHLQWRRKLSAGAVATDCACAGMYRAQFQRTVRRKTQTRISARRA